MRKISLLLTMVVIALVAVIAAQQLALAAAPMGVNVALGRPVTCSGFINGETPERAVDGMVVNNSKWCYDSADSKWLRVDLGQIQTITRWVVKHAGYGGEIPQWNTRGFLLYYSVDGYYWYIADWVDGNTENITDRTLATPICARYVELDISQPTQEIGNNCARIYEFELYNSTNVTFGKGGKWVGSQLSGHEDTKACDGNDYTYWATYDWPNRSYVCENFFGVFPINKVVIKHAGAGNMNAAWNTRDFEVILWEGDTVAYRQTFTGNTANLTELNLTIPVLADAVEVKVTVPSQSPTPDPEIDMAIICEIEAYTNCPNPMDITVDESSSNAVITGSWVYSTGYPEQRWGEGYRYYSMTKYFDSTANIKFNANVAYPGYYDIYTRWPATSNSNTAVRYNLYRFASKYNITPETFTYNQQQNGGIWQYMGRYYVSQNQGAVQIWSAPSGFPASYVRADAVRFKYADSAYTNEVGVTTSASSTYPGYSSTKVIDHDYSAAFGGGSSWANYDPLPQWLEITFPEMRTFNMVQICTTQGYELKDYQIQYFDGTNWYDAMAPVTGNTQTYMTHKFPKVTATKMRILCNSGPAIEPYYARINEVVVSFTFEPAYN